MASLFIADALGKPLSIGVQVSLLLFVIIASKGAAGRALTSFAGNAVATVLVGTWTGEFDRDKADRVLRGDDPFDESTMLDEDADEDEPATRRSADESTAAAGVPA